MHNIDRTVGGPNYEYNNEYSNESSMNPETYEYSGEFEGEMEMENEFVNELNGMAGEANEYSGEMGYETAALSGEAMEMEMATELLEVSNEQELEQFLGGLIKRAAGAVKSFANSSAGKALGGILKSAAKQALPIAAGALGTAIGGPAGGMIGSKLGTYASNLFELELEGLSNEDKEFELAKAYVRFANNAVRNASRNPQHRRYPRQISRNAVIAAAKRYAPGLLRKRPAYGRSNYRQAPVYANNSYNNYTPNNQGASNYQDPSNYQSTSNSNGTSGTWYKQGNQIIINMEEM